jgi:hypothetical protein
MHTYGSPITASPVTTKTVTTKLAASHLAFGGAGIGGLIVHLIIWHLIWRLLALVWHIHTFGPVIVFAVIAAFIGYRVWRRQRGPGGFTGFGRRRGGSSGYGTGSGPRDW